MVRVVPDCIVEGATGDIERSTGFRLQTHRLVLTGVCPTCQAGGDLKT